MTQPAENSVVMAMPIGFSVPSIVHLPDATTVVPDASGQITVAARLVPVLLGNGWQIVVDSGTTHVP